MSVPVGTQSDTHIITRQYKIQLRRGRWRGRRREVIDAKAIDQLSASSSYSADDVDQGISKGKEKGNREINPFLFTREIERKSIRMD